jgi:hypothetical protein
MFKRLLIAAVLILAGLFYGWQHNAVKTTYVNGLALYTDLPGTEYIVERDCYIFKLVGRDSDLPLIGDHDVVPELPATVTAGNVGADLPGVRILDLARVGDRFRIISVRKDESRLRTTLTFEILFEDEATRKYPRLDAFWIMDHAPEARSEAPRIIETYAARQNSH